MTTLINQSETFINVRTHAIFFPFGIKLELRNNYGKLIIIILIRVWAIFYHIHIRLFVA